MADASKNNALGFTFLMIGFTLSVSLATTLGVAFIGTGIPFAIIGLVFMGKNKDGNAPEGEG